MNKYFCLTCDHVWNDVDMVCCPKCKSTDCINDGATDEQCDLADFGDGHFEGDLYVQKPGGYFQDDTGE